MPERTTLSCEWVPDDKSAENVRPQVLPGGKVEDIVGKAWKEFEARNLDAARREAEAAGDFIDTTPQPTPTKVREDKSTDYTLRRRGRRRGEEGRWSEAPF